MTVGSYTYNTIDGNPAPDNCIGQFTNGANGEWYAFTHTTTENITISTNLANNAGADTRFHVYQDTCGNLTCVGGNDDGSGLLSVFTFGANATTTYYIIFDNRWESTSRDFEISTGGGNTTSPINFTTLSPGISITGEGRAVVDMNNDFLDDIVAITSTNINIHYQTGSGFTEANYTTISAATPGWSLAAADYDANGYTDLLYGNGSAVTFMKANDTGSAYTKVTGASSVFSQRSNFADINNDGHLDAFVCHDTA